MQESVVYRLQIGNRVQIGSTSRFETRIAEHRSALEKGNHCNSFMQNTFNKYRTFEASVVSTHITREQAYEAEQLLLEKYYGQEGYLMQNKNATSPPVKWGKDNPRSRPEVISKGIETKRSNGSLQCSQSTKLKISQANRGRVQSKEEKYTRAQLLAAIKQQDGYKERHIEGVLSSFTRRSDQAKANSTELFRINNPSYKVQTCQYCNRDIRGASAFSRFHGENCKTKYNTNNLI